MKMIATAVATVLATLFAFPTRGEEEVPPPCQTVAECTEWGTEAYRGGRYALAATALRRANDLEPSEVVRLNLAQALEGEGSCASLLEAQEIYQGLSDTTGAVSESAGAGLVRIAAPLAVCEEEATPSAPEPPQPPTHSEAPPRATEEPPVASAPRPHRNRLETAGWVLFSTGLAIALTGGSILWPLAGDAAGERDTHCSTRMGCSSQNELEQWQNANERWERLALWGDVLVGVGGVVAITGLVMALVARHRHGRETTAVVSLLPSGNGLALLW